MEESEVKPVPLYDISGQTPVLGDMHPDDVHEAIASGQFQFPKGSKVPVINKDGQLGDIPAEDAPNAFSSGDYKYATSKLINEAKYGGIGQQTIAALEGAGEGLVGPISPLVERGLGIKTEDIRGRKEAGPGHTIGNIAGLTTGMFTGTGEAALMTKAGEGAAELAGLANLAKEAPLFQRIGSSALQQATEMAVLQGGDEASKMIVQDPEASAESAIANIGMAAALGGAGGAFMTGAVSPLWKATVGDRTDQFLSSLSSKLGGVEGAASQAAELGAKAGIEIPAELAAKIDNAPGAADAFSKLSQTDTTMAGKSIQKTLNGFHEELGAKAAEAFGKDASYISNIPDLDKYSTGQRISETLHDDLKKELIDPVTKEYDVINNKFKEASISAQNLKQTSESIAQKAIDQGWNKAASDSQTKLMEKVLDKLPLQTTAEDLKKFITNLRESNPYGSETYGAARDISKSLSEAQGRAISEGILAKGGTEVESAALLKNYEGLKGQYSDLMGKLEDLNEHLHLGKWDGPKSFLSALKEKGASKGEALLQSLSGSNRAQALELLAKVSPSTLEEVKNFHIDKLLDSAIGKNKELNVNKLITNFEKLSPQVKQLIANEEQVGKLQAINELMTRLTDNTHNWSNTARTMDKITRGSITPIAMLAGLMGHGTAAILTELGGLGFTEGKDALKLGMLKFLGSNQPIKSEGFKAMVQFLHNTYKGENLISKAAADVFKSGAQVLTSNLLPAKADRETLDKQVSKIQDAPGKMAELQNGHVGHYLSSHQAALTEVSARAFTYLQHLKPKPFKPTPLSREIPPTAAEKARYNRALDIAQQPAIIMQHIKNGTLQQSDMTDLGAMYPGLYKTMAAKLSNEMTDAVSNGQAIPYKTRMGLSLFLGQPLDGSMNPHSIQAAQAIYLPKAPQQPQGMAPKGSPSKISEKSAKAYQTPLQASESRHNNHK